MAITFTQLCFYFFASVMLVSALLVVSVNNPVRAALFLILSFVSAACVWITLEAEFLAIVLVLVYVGAVMVLFLFVIMMLDIEMVVTREGFVKYMPVGAVVGLIIVMEMILLLSAGSFSLSEFPAPAAHGADYSNTSELGVLLYTLYLYPFEIAGLILLVAIVAAIALTLRHRMKDRYIDPSDQIKVDPKDRVKMVNLASEDLPQ